MKKTQSYVKKTNQCSKNKYIFQEKTAMMTNNGALDYFLPFKL